MSDAKVRRPVQETAPEDTSGRRGCLIFGAVAGLVVGTLISLFLVPPLFRHYFGAADIALGKSYSGDAKVIRVVEAAREPGADGQQFPGVFVVRIEATSNKSWAPLAADFELELTTGGEKVPLARSEPPLGTLLALGEKAMITLTFEGTQRRDSQPAKLHLREPNVRFHLQPGKPK